MNGIIKHKNFKIVLEYSYCFWAAAGLGAVGRLLSAESSFATTAEWIQL